MYGPTQLHPTAMIYMPIHSVALTCISISGLLSHFSLVIYLLLLLISSHQNIGKESSEQLYSKKASGQWDVQWAESIYLKVNTSDKRGYILGTLIKSNIQLYGFFAS